jgi:hypothetical protein
VLEGLPEHRDTVEEFRLVSRQLEAAKAEQKDALLIAELEDELQAANTKLVIAAECALLPVIVAPLRDILPQ